MVAITRPRPGDPASDRAVLRALLAAEQDLLARDPRGRTALHIAAIRADTRAIRAILRTAGGSATGAADDDADDVADDVDDAAKSRSSPVNFDSEDVRELLAAEDLDGRTAADLAALPPSDRLTLRALGIDDPESMVQQPHMPPGMTNRALAADELPHGTGGWQYDGDNDGKAGGVDLKTVIPGVDLSTDHCDWDTHSAQTLTVAEFYLNYFITQRPVRIANLTLAGDDSARSLLTRAALSYSEKSSAEKKQGKGAGQKKRGRHSRDNSGDSESGGLGSFSVGTGVVPFAKAVSRGEEICC
jgi:hypothetical protein